MKQAASQLKALPEEASAAPAMKENLLGPLFPGALRTFMHSQKTMCFRFTRAFPRTKVMILYGTKLKCSTDNEFESCQFLSVTIYSLMLNIPRNLATKTFIQLLKLSPIYFC